ncbi:MAG: hypothetical protein A3E83_04115 [Gammaproteobacteria bacterium RIFCSPHIGHO2_12_FULL_41_20]|nr:MAG: hypothetical protein A3E83_04115 [Gammaproteobacteria bacterium RIFCSPHIGHO2_12_FULL_41_20]
MSISEIIVILLVAFLVIKPEQLPEVAFTLGRCMQWLRSSMGRVKGEVNAFIHAIEQSNERQSK